MLNKPARNLLLQNIHIFEIMNIMVYYNKHFFKKIQHKELLFSQMPCKCQTNQNYWFTV